IVDALNGVNERVSPHDKQICRLAALVHDIGHYPFSHAMEDAVQDYYKEALIKDESEPDKLTEAALGDEGLHTFQHERLGKEVITRDKEIREALEEAGIDPQDLANLFMRIKPSPLANIISSDLDADRLDYLQRTAIHSGLPYGRV